MEIIDLKKLNVNKKLKIDPKLDKFIPKMNNFNDHFLIRDINKINLNEKSEFNKRLIQTPELKPEPIINPPMNVFDHSIKSWEEIEDFEFKNLDLNNFYDKEIKRVNHLLI